MKTQGKPGTKSSRKRSGILSKRQAFVKDKLERRLFIVPNLITVTGTFCGFLSVVSSINGHFEYAAKLIALAIIIDGLDGRIARRLNATSAFGREFDSLSDCIAFGVAPAILLYQWGFTQFADEFGILVSFLVVACTAARLARFNVTTQESGLGSFDGLPSPGAAAALASLVYLDPSQQTSQLLVSLYLIYAAIVAGLMVSSISYPSVKSLRLSDINLEVKNQLQLILLVSLAVALTWYNSRIIIFLGSTIYAISGLILHTYQARNKEASNEPESTPEENPEEMQKATTEPPS